MADMAGRLNEAADYLDYLHEGSKHIPTDLVHDRDFRVGLVCTRNQSADQTVAQFFWGGAAEVFLTLGPAVLPLLAALLRSEAEGVTTINRPVNYNAATLAAHILKTKES